MKFKIHIDNVEHPVEAAADGTVVIDGETFPAHVSSPGDDRRTVQVGDTNFEIRTVEDCADTGIFVLELAGERIPLTVTDVVRERGGVGGSSRARARAPTRRRLPPEPLRSRQVAARLRSRWPKKSRTASGPPCPERLSKCGSRLATRSPRATWFSSSRP